ncbi:hypothetical protein NDU88_005798 [Pleurodeles waltl]|uniref:Uncharacterized protein n=1 Tax=Pleurodeles waltl TaxID=8319 RepID=A0AAV7WZL5_PLEWA|nr:hypothetical protein NDU88_005798 [Pleurodeles waltl]
MMKAVQRYQGTVDLLLHTFIPEIPRATKKEAGLACLRGKELKTGTIVLRWRSGCVFSKSTDLLFIRIINNAHYSL